MVAQVTEDGIGLGGFLEGFKVDVDSYEKVINKFKELKLGKQDFKLDDGKADWDAISKAIGTTDERAISYFKTMDKGNGTIDNTSASVDGMSAYLNEAGLSFDFASIKATLLNTALNAGIFLVAKKCCIKKEHTLIMYCRL